MIINTKFTSTSDIHTVFDGVVEVYGGDVPIYKGEHVIVPKPNEGTELETKGKQIKENIKVLEIPCLKVSNKYGTTVSIGE